MEADGRGQDSRVDTRGETCWEIHHRQRICGKRIRDSYFGGFCCVYNWNTVSS